MSFPRSAGILLHPTSLPGPYGIGEIGPVARQMVGTLEKARQRYWQMLPLGPTGYADSPYQSLSTFAGNEMLVSFEDLVEEGLLRKEELRGRPEFPVDRVDYGPVLEWRGGVLDRVCRAFPRRASRGMKEAFAAFREEQADWLEEYALFSALKQEHQLRPWTEWAPELVRREPSALAAARKRLAARLRGARIRQFLFDHQWRRLREAARAAGIHLIGDIPIFVSHDSADVWANPELFHLDGRGMPTVVAGVPPDYFSATGQLWGNPLYRWERHQAEGFAWWLRRIQRTMRRVDVVRIDHFRGFESCWEIPAGEETAVNGRWVKAPGVELFEALRANLGELPILAEDLGIITEEVDALRDRFALPGMRILQFSFAGDLKPHLKPEGFPENCVVYTGTHDNDTTRGWFWREPGVNNTESLAQVRAEREAVLRHTGTDGSQIHWDLIALAHRLPPHTAIVPLQDVMGLGSEARMNVPGRMGGNWAWRFAQGDLRAEDMDRLRDITLWAGRG